MATPNPNTKLSPSPHSSYPRPYTHSTNTNIQCQCARFGISCRFAMRHASNHRSYRVCRSNANQPTEPSKYTYNSPSTNKHNSQRWNIDSFGAYGVYTHIVRPLALMGTVHPSLLEPNHPLAYLRCALGLGFCAGSCCVAMPMRSSKRWRPRCYRSPP